MSCGGSPLSSPPASPLPTSLRRMRIGTMVSLLLMGALATGVLFWTFGKNASVAHAASDSPGEKLSGT